MRVGVTSPVGVPVVVQSDRNLCDVFLVGVLSSMKTMVAIRSSAGEDFPKDLGVAVTPTFRISLH